jgi:hypothetical protein
VEQVALHSGAALKEGTSKQAEWRSAFESLGELPRGDERALKTRFERALDRVRAAVSRQRASEQEQALADLFEAARRIHAYGWATAGRAPASERDALKSAAETFIAGVARWPKGAAEALTDAWANAQQSVGADSDTALRMLCIRRELQAGLATPPEDQELRREHQMRRLVDHMGQRGHETLEDFGTLALEWVRVGGVAPERYECLLERFRGPTPE